MQIQLQLLLDKTAVIKLRQEFLQSDEIFNIFRILRAGHEEVMLHSRFLYELLNPKGSHGMGDLFLRLFTVTCDLPTLSFDTVRVMREHANIDILIQDNSRAIVIENKIYAGDQPEQLKRYFNYIQSSFRQPTLLYLTLNGDVPSSQSVGDLLEKPKLISYRNEITNWITACIKEAALKPALRETLLQYKALINQLTSNAMNETEKQDVLELMAQGDNAEQAAIIARNWNHVRWHTEWDFWNELLALAESTFSVSSEERFSDDGIDLLVHGGQHKKYDYGLRFNIGTIYGADLIFKIGRGNGDAPMYYGLYNPQSGSSENNIIHFYKVMNAVIQHQDVIQDEYWIGYKYTLLGIDFENFSNSITLQLANREKRQRIVGQLWQEIELFINEVSQCFSRKYGADFVSI